MNRLLVGIEFSTSETPSVYVVPFDVTMEQVLIQLKADQFVTLREWNPETRTSGKFIAINTRIIDCVVFSEG